MTIKIHIDGGTYLTSDSRQFMVSDFKGHDKNGNEQWNNRGFYTSISGALEAYARQETLNSDAQNWEELIDVLHMVQNTLRRIENEISKARGAA
jgi:hypothetical protein